MFWETGLPSPRVSSSDQTFQLSPFLLFFSKLCWHHELQCVAVDAVIEKELVSALQVSVFPEILFTKAWKILHRDKGNKETHSTEEDFNIITLRWIITWYLLWLFVISGVRSAEEWSKIMAFFCYKAVRPSWLSQAAGQSREDPINLINKERIYTTAVSLCCSEVGKIVSCWRMYSVYQQNNDFHQFIHNGTLLRQNFSVPKRELRGGKGKRKRGEKNLNKICACIFERPSSRSSS